MEPQHEPTPMQHPWVSWLAGVAALGSGAAVVMWLAQPVAAPAAKPRAAGPTSSWSQLPPGAAVRERMPLTATLRWGQTASTRATPLEPDAAAHQWDGWLALDCGEVVGREALGWERLPALPGQATDTLGPVVWADDGSQRVYWRSVTRDDWDGVRVRLRACPRSPLRESGSTLRIVTPERSWSAKLGWSQDDFSAIPMGDGGNLEIHIGVDKDPSKVYGARITDSAPQPADSEREMAAEPQRFGGEPRVE